MALLKAAALFLLKRIRDQRGNLALVGHRSASVFQFVTVVE